MKKYKKSLEEIVTKNQDLVPKIPKSKNNCKITFPDGKVIELPLLKSIDN